MSGIGLATPWMQKGGGCRDVQGKRRWEAVRSHGALLALQSKEFGIYSQGSGEIEGLKQGRDVT